MSNLYSSGIGMESGRTHITNDNSQKFKGIDRDEHSQKFREDISLRPFVRKPLVIHYDFHVDVHA